MDKRTKILLSIFSVIVAYTVFSSMIYPAYVEPLVTIKDRIAEEQKTLDKLEEQDMRFELAKREYRRLAERVGAMDIGKVENALRARLDELIIKHNLEGASVAPSRGTADKSGIERMAISISGTGTLESAIRFMQDVSELPQLIRVGNVTVYPASSGRRNEKTNRVNMRLPIEVVVLPQQKVLGKRLTDKDLQQPEKMVRHQGRDYSAIWKKTPFTDFVPLPQLVANAGQPQTVPVGQSVTLQGSATGGDGKYVYEWTCDGLPAQQAQSVAVDTSAIGQKNCNLVVKDGSENAASARVTITIVEPPPPAALTASAGQSQSVQLGQSVVLQGSATGGDGKYTYKWSGPGLSAQDQASVPVNTTSVGTTTYLLTVTDGSGESSTAEVTVTVIEPPPVPVVRNTWTDRNMRQVAMTLQTQGVPGREGELLVVNQGTRERTYHAVGDDFDGGKLVYVDTRGGIVKWEDKFFIYPLGSRLDQDIPADSATNHPELLRIVERLKLADAAPDPKVAPESQPSSVEDARPVAPDGAAVPLPTSNVVGEKPAETVQPDTVPLPEGQAAAPVPADGTAPAKEASSEINNEAVVPPTAAQAAEKPPVQDVVKQRPARAKPRRPSRTKPAPVSPAESQEKPADAPSGQK